MRSELLVPVMHVQLLEVECLGMKDLEYLLEEVLGDVLPVLDDEYRQVAVELVSDGGLDDWVGTHVQRLPGAVAVQTHAVRGVGESGA